MNKSVKSICSNMQNSVLKLLIFVGIFFTVTTNAFTQNGNGEMLFTSGTTGNLSWMLYTNGALIIRGSGTMPNYSSGDTPWNSYMSSINAVTIETGVTSIGNNAFRGGTNITNVKMPNSITVIRENAFSECNNLIEITFFAIAPQQIEIRNDAFHNVEKATCKLWVPDESVALYRFANEWRDFIVVALSDYDNTMKEQTDNNEGKTTASNEETNKPKLPRPIPKRGELSLYFAGYDDLVKEEHGDIQITVTIRETIVEKKTDKNGKSYDSQRYNNDVIGSGTLKDGFSVTFRDPRSDKYMVIIKAVGGSIFSGIIGSVRIGDAKVDSYEIQLRPNMPKTEYDLFVNHTKNTRNVTTYSFVVK